MVSQKVVEEVMVKLNRPCTTRDIANYLKGNNLSNITSDITPDISNNLNALRRWCVTDKYPDLHGPDSNKWYLVKNGTTHDPKICDYCKKIRRSHSRSIGDYAQRQVTRKIRKVNDAEFLSPEGFDLTTRRW